MNFIVENWYLFVLAFVSGGMLFLPMLKSGANGLTPSAAVLLVNREKAVLIDVRDAALRALEASEPAAPLLVLDLTSDSLQRLLQRMATAATPQAA